jgi:diguanylate cyclase (GGDEF)-like protein
MASETDGKSGSTKPSVTYTNPVPDKPNGYQNPYYPVFDNETDAPTYQQTVRPFWQDMGRLHAYEQSTGRMPLAPQLLPSNYQGPKGTPGIDRRNFEGDTFWSNPQRVARYYLSAQALPAGAPRPVDTDNLGIAYSYLQARNQGKPFWLWDNDVVGDPDYNDFVSGIGLPDPSAIDDADRELWQKQYPEIGQNGMQPGTYQPADQPQQTTMNMPQDVWDSLPWWQKVIIPALPQVSKAVGAISGGIVGAGLGGPVGAVGGAIAGYGTSAYMESGVDPETGEIKKNTAGTLAELLMKLDLPAEWLERSMGVLGQIGASLQDPEHYGPVLEILNNLPEAWQAGHSAENVAFAQLTGEQVTNWQLGQATPQMWTPPDDQNASSWALTQIRRELMANPNVTGEAINAKYEALFGFAGQARDMIGHMMLDPLNYLGLVTNKGISTAGKLAGNTELTKAFSFGDDTLKGMQEYGRLVRQMPQAEAAHLGGLTKWIAGLDEAGNLKDFVRGPKRGGVRGMLDSFTGLTPAARASEALNYTIDGVSTFLNDHAQTPEQAVKLVQALAGSKPEDAVKALDGAEMPTWFQSAEAQHIPLALRDSLPNAQALLKGWQAARPNAGILQRVADLMGEDVNKLMARLHTATPTEAQTLFRAFMDGLGERAKVEPGAGTLLQTLTGDQSLSKLDGMALKKMADGFLAPDGVPFHPQDFNARLMVVLAESADNWAAKWFDVKPAGWAVRMGGLVKRAQSMALLGLNPSYFLNNALNNVVTLAWDGLLSFNTRASRDAWYKEMGVNPTRRDAGLGAAEIGKAETTEIGQAIRGAGRGNDLIQKAEDFTHLGGVADKVQVFALLSQKLERASSDIAMVTAMREFWNRTWREGAGFDQIPAQLRQVLDDFQPGLGKKVESAVRRGKNRAQIEQEVFGNLSRKSLHDVLTPEQKASFDSRFPGVFDELEVSVGKAQTNEEVHAAFAGARQRVQDGLTDKIKLAQEHLTTEAMHKASIEGQPGVLDLADDLVQSRTDQHLAHFERMDAVATQAEQYTGAARQALWDQALREADRDWSNFETIEHAKWLGLYRGLGADDPARDFLLARLRETHDNHSAFFSQRRELMNEYFEFKATTEDETARAAKYAEIQGKLNDEYVTMAVEEDRLQRLIDTNFAETFGKDSGLSSDAEKWRTALQKNRRQQAAAMVAYRSGDIPERLYTAWGSDVLPGHLLEKIQRLNKGKPAWQLSLDERAKAAKKFYAEIYTPLIRQGLDESAKTVPVVGAKKPKAPKAVTPAPVVTPDERMLWAATHDPLTRFKNRTAFDGQDELGIPGEWPARLAANPDAKVAVSDLRGLHMTNDDPQAGYKVGDAYLRAVAQAYRDEGLEAYRLGGDEFAAIFDDTKAAEEAMKRVQSRIENAIIVVKDGDNDRTYAGAKIHYGIADEPTAAHDLGQRARDADNALRAAAGLPEYGRAYKLERTAGSAAGAAAPGLGDGAPGAGERPAAAPRTDPTPEQRAAVDATRERLAGGPAPTVSDNPLDLPAADAVAIAQHLSDNDLVLVHPESGKIVTPESLEPSIEQRRSELRIVAHEYDKKVTADKHLVNIVNKYTAEKVTRIEDITPAQLRKAFETRARDKAGITDSQKVTTAAQAIERGEDPKPILPNDGLSDTARRFLTRPTRFLPNHLKERVWSTARMMLEDMNSVGTVVIPETHQIRRDGAPWYWDLYDATDKHRKGTLHKSTQRTLTEIIAGNDKPEDELAYRVKNIIMDWMGGTSRDQGPDGDPGMMWHLGKRDEVAQFLENHPESMAGDELLKLFGSQKAADEVVNYWVNWLERKENPELPVPEPIAEPVAAIAEAIPEPQAAATLPTTPVEPPVPAPRRTPAPVGTLDSVSEPPLESAALEGWLKELSPLLDRAESGLTGQEGMRYDLAGLDPVSKKALQGYLGKVYGQLTDTKMGAIRWGETRRDMALLNYTRRYGMDNVLGTVMPYEFWMTRSMVKWAGRALNKPAILANYARLRTFGDNAVEGEGFPTRLKRKMGIALPFLPEWMGGGIYADPLRQVFPFENLVSPFQKLADQNNLEEKRAEGLINQRLSDEDISADEATQAIENHAGPVWNEVVAQAREEVERDIQNPLDFAGMMAGYSLPVQWALKAAQGRSDEIGQLPVTRGVQALTASMGIGGPRGWNIEAGPRRLLGLPEVDRFEDYRIDRMLANLAAEGTISADEARRAMMDQSGEAFTLAQQRVSQMGLTQYLGAPLGVDFFPEGEQKQRRLAGEYDTAIGAWKRGDDQALSNFFDKYPEYQARMASFQEPEERLKRFLISEVWQAYNALPGLYKKQAREQMGDLFNDAFLNKETRAYDAIQTASLAGWAQQLGANNPASAPVSPNTLPLKLADPAIAQKVEAFNATRSGTHQQAMDINGLLYSLPEDQQDAFRAQYQDQLKAYSTWRNQQLATQPEIIPYVTDADNGGLAALPADQQQLVYQFRALRDEQFPDLDQQQDEYFALTDKGQKRYYRETHPDLAKYWDFRSQYAAAYPTVASYIVGEDKVSKALDPQYQVNQAVIQQFSTELTRQWMGAQYAGESLSSGARSELKRLWVEAGQPSGNFNNWLMTLRETNLQ